MDAGKKTKEKKKEGANVKVTNEGRKEQSANQYKSSLYWRTSFCPSSSLSSFSLSFLSSSSQSSNFPLQEKEREKWNTDTENEDEEDTQEKGRKKMRMKHTYTQVVDTSQLLHNEGIKKRKKDEGRERRKMKRKGRRERRDMEYTLQDWSLI